MSGSDYYISCATYSQLLARDFRLYYGILCCFSATVEVIIVWLTVMTVPRCIRDFTTLCPRN